MARIKCKNCGKVYHYETEGCCPECGAYNRPPRKERVSSDGTIYHMKAADSPAKRRTPAKPSGGKVCFEEETRRAEQAWDGAKVRDGEASQAGEWTPPAGETAASADTVQDWLRRHRTPIRLSEGGKTVVVLAVVILLLLFLKGGVRSCAYHNDKVEVYEGPVLQEFTVKDGVALVYLEDVDDMTSGTLWYMDTEDYLQCADVAHWEDQGDVCIMYFDVGENCQRAEWIEIFCGDDDEYYQVEIGAEIATAER